MHDINTASSGGAINKWVILMHVVGVLLGDIDSMYSYEALIQDTVDSKINGELPDQTYSYSNNK
jgi:hypothetical protein